MVDLSMDLLHCGQTRNLCALNFTQVEAESIGSAAIIDPPGLSWIYTQWEKEFKWYKFHEIFCSVTPILPIVCCILYGLLCTVGRQYMANRKPFDLRWALFVWNLSLSIFSVGDLHCPLVFLIVISFIGFVRIMPHLILCIWEYGLCTMLTTSPLPYFGYGPTGVWLYLFVFSKVPELGDTLFIILRKKPLLFLHWYHHVSVLLYCWHSIYIHSPYGIIFAVMNYGVHSVMYMYYSLSTFKIRLCPPPYITALQISQMFVGIAICYASWSNYLQGEGDLSFENLATGSIIYVSYAILFLQYAIKRFWNFKTTSKRPQQLQRPLKEVATKQNGVLNNGYHRIGVIPAPTSSMPFESGSKLATGMTLPFKEVANTKGMSLNDGGIGIMKTSGVCTGHMQMAHHQMPSNID